jgi:hypothetical protein
VILTTGLHAGTIFLLTLWTLWLLAALPLLGHRWKRFGLLAVFVPLALVVAIRTDVTWDSYLITWLAVHTALAAAAAVQNRRQAWAAAASLGGLLWLWGAGGWQYGRYVTTAMLILVAGAALAGLGFGGCWILLVRPLRKRAGDSARQAAAAAGRAARTQRALASTTAQLATERQEHQAALAESTRQNEALKLRLHAEQESREQERRVEQRTRDRYRNGLQQAHRNRDLPRGADSDTGQPDGTADDPDELAAPGDVTIVRLRFSYTTGEPADAEAARGRAVLPRAARLGLVIKRDELTVPRDSAGDIDDLLEAGGKARDDATFRERFIDAASDYAGSKIGDNTFDVWTRQWQTRDVGGVDAVAQVLSQSDEWLHDVAGRPLEGIAGGIGLNGPAAGAIGGIGSNIFLAPLDREIQGAVQFCEIVGIGIGLAFGIHLLAISCTKSLLRDKFGEALGSAIKNAAENAFCDRDVISASRDQESAVPGRAAVGEVAEGPASPIGDRGPLDSGTLTIRRARDYEPPRTARDARSDLTERRRASDPYDEPGDGITGISAIGW